MKKTWNLTFYDDGKPVAEKQGVSHSDAVVELYRLARGEAGIAEPQPALSETAELRLAA
jgi:hypothetical protein